MDKVNNVTFRFCEQKLTEKEFLDFEENLGVKLPDDFKTHYMQFNGGFPNANWSTGIKFVCPLFRFLPIKYGGNTIEEKLQELQFANLLPFAINKIMGYFCIGTRNDNYGKIFYYRKTPDVPNKKIWFGKEEIELHCANFSDFISNLQRDNFYGKVRKPPLGWVEDFEAYKKSL
jgi:hypothetical protein